MPVGEYCVTILEKVSECSVFACFDVPQANDNPFALTITPTNSTCYGGNTGALSVSVNVQNFNPNDYTYSWSNIVYENTGGVPMATFVPIGTTQEIADLEAGWYSVVVTANDTGCSSSTNYLFWSSPLEGLTVTGTMSPNCGDFPVILNTTIAGGSGNYSYEWGTGNPVTPIPGATEHEYAANNPGTYYVRVTDNDTGCIGVETFKVENIKSILIEAEVKNTCSGGKIALTLSGGTPPYSVLWDDDNMTTTTTIEGLSEGEHCVTVTDANGCTADACYMIMESVLNISDVTIVDNDCASSCNGSIDIEIMSSNSVTYEWSSDELSNNVNTQDLEGLCVGDYTVKIISDGCEAEMTYSVGGEEDGDAAFNVVVSRHFGANSDGSAHVDIYSSLFSNGGSVFIQESNQSEDIVFNSNGAVARFDIPIAHKDVTLFHFTFTNPSGCTYEDTFPWIPECQDDDGVPGFGFSYTYLGDEESSCGGVNSYWIEITELNLPYTVEVTMVDAYDTGNDNYVQIVEYTEYGPLQIDNIPSGWVRFRMTDNCGNSVGGFQNAFSPQYDHVNCCLQATCELIGDAEVMTSGGSHNYDYDYFRLQHKSFCFGDESKIRIIPTGAPIYNCWTGTVTIEYPDGPPAIFNVVANTSGGYDMIEWESGSDSWEPGSPDIYYIKIIYTGNDDTTDEDDCETVLPLIWYDNSTYPDAIGFNNDFWFNTDDIFGGDMPSTFNDAYFGAWRCEICSQDPEFIYENDQDECDQNFGNWQFTYFLFTPANGIYDDNPCDNPGTITIMDFDENGLASVIDVPVSGNSAIDEFWGAQPFGLPSNMSCSESGWCLFEALDVYPGTFLMPDNIPLIASWANTTSCEVVPPVDDPFAGGDCDPDEINSCPPGYICINETCYEECDDDGDCPDGAECQEIDGYNVCVQGLGEADCTPDCPEGFECIDGVCVSENSGDLCNYSDNAQGGGENIYTFQHTLDPGTNITFTYNPYFQPDEFSLTGVTGPDIPCTTESGSQEYQVTSGNVITIKASPCPGANSSTYFLSLTCEAGIAQNSVSIINTTDIATIDEMKISVNPNPFQNAFELEVNTMNEGNVKIEIFNLLGNNFLKENTEVAKGRNKFNYDLDLPVGVYQVIVTDEKGNSSTQRIIRANN